MDKKTKSLEPFKFVNAKDKDGQWYQFDQPGPYRFTYPCKCGNNMTLEMKSCIAGFGSCDKCGQKIPDFSFMVESTRREETDKDKKFKSAIEKAVETSMKKSESVFK